MGCDKIGDQLQCGVGKRPPDLQLQGSEDTYLTHYSGKTEKAIIYENERASSRCLLRNCRDLPCSQGANNWKLRKWPAHTGKNFLDLLARSSNLETPARCFVPRPLTGIVDVHQLQLSRYTLIDQRWVDKAVLDCRRITFSVQLRPQNLALNVLTE